VKNSFVIAKVIDRFIDELLKNCDRHSSIIILIDEAVFDR
jgi:hypothetical protein